MVSPIASISRHRLISRQQYRDTLFQQIPQTSNQEIQLTMAHLSSAVSRSEEEGDSSKAESTCGATLISEEPQSGKNEVKAMHLFSLQSK